LSETLIEPDPNDANATVLELDELWSFVLKKVNKYWIWIALCRKTRQVFSYAIGDISKETGEKLWNKIPLVYRSGKCFTDFYSVYKNIIPEDQHYPVVTVDKRIAPLTAAPNRTGRFPFIRLFSVWSFVIDTLCVLRMSHIVAMSMKNTFVV
jgi:IS1 family transposase